MKQGTIKWQVPVGETDHLAEQGIQDTGETIFIKGGPAVTAGGLVFISTDDKLLAYDIDDGSELWSAPLPATGQGIPAVYEVKGRQYVVVGANTSNRWGQLPAQTRTRIPQYIAFSLPDSPE